jgi:hypothetical protein
MKAKARAQTSIRTKGPRAASDEIIRWRRTDCAGRADGDDIQIMWVAAVCQVILTLAYAYSQVKSPNDNLDDVLDSISDSLDKINDRLSTIEGQLNQVLATLERLPEVIRGIVDDGFFRDALSRANTAQGRIRDFIGKIDQNIDKIELDLREIEYALGAMRTFGGVKGLLMSSPYLTTWLAGSMAVETFKAKGGNYSIQSPWRRTPMAEYKKRFERFFKDMLNYDGALKKTIIPGLPARSKEAERSYFDIVKGRFAKDFGAAPDGTFLLKCPGFELNPFMFRVNGKSTGLKEDVIPTLPSAYQPKARDGLRLWNEYTNTIAQIVIFYDTAEDLYQKRADLLGAFVEPASWK